MTIFYLDFENGNDANDGSSWAQAWKTISSGATSARIAPGDIIRVAKSPAPESLGTTALWTNKSRNVTLTTAKNANIDMCETAWTANGSGDATVTRTAIATDGKEGSYCMKIALDSSPQTNTMQAYYATGTLDLSSYSKISFWIKNSSAILTNNWTITLCSDTAGATPVDTFNIIPIPSSSSWVPLVLTRNGGGNLGGSIQSIAINTGSVAPTSSSFVYVDNFIACTTSGLNLQSLISKSSSDQVSTEGWYAIKSINGTSITIDNETNSKAGVGDGYYGTTETATTYKRETIKIAMQSSETTTVNSVQDVGNPGAYIEFQGGYNTSTTIQDGETFIDGLNGKGVGIYLATRRWIKLNLFDFCRYYYGLFITSSVACYIDNINNCVANSVGILLSSQNTRNTFNHLGHINNNLYGLWIEASWKNVFTNIDNINNCYTSSINMTNDSYENIFRTVSVANISNYSVYPSRSYFENLTIKDVSYALNIISTPSYIKNLTTENVSTYFTIVDNTDFKLYIQSHNGGYPKVITDNATIEAQLATAGGTGIEWKLSPTSSIYRTIARPVCLPIGRIAVNPDSEVSVSCYFKKSHATDISAQLFCRGGQIDGVSNDVTTLCPDDTARNLVTIQFTPTESGVVEVEAQAWWSAGTADENVIVDDITVTQV